MASKSILTTNSKSYQVEQMYYAPVAVLPPPIGTNISTLYCFLSRVVPWTDEENPPQPTQDQQSIKQPGFTTCIVTLTADVEQQKNPIRLYLNRSLFDYRDNDEVKFKGVVNKAGALAIYNLNNGNYHRVYVTMIATPHKEFMIPSKNDTGRILATLPKGQDQSKEMIMFLFSQQKLDFKQTYTPMEMKSLIDSIPPMERKVVNRYVNIVK